MVSLDYLRTNHCFSRLSCTFMSFWKISIVEYASGGGYTTSTSAAAWRSRDQNLLQGQRCGALRPPDGPGKQAQRTFLERDRLRLLPAPASISMETKQDGADQQLRSSVSVDQAIYRCL